jgi:hypothetical protein
MGGSNPRGLREFVVRVCAVNLLRFSLLMRVLMMMDQLGAAVARASEKKRRKMGKTRRTAERRTLGACTWAKSNPPSPQFIAANGVLPGLYEMGTRITAVLT